MVAKKKSKKKTSKKKEKLICPVCGTDQVVTTIFDTLSADARPIKEMEIKKERTTPIVGAVCSSSTRLSCNYWLFGLSASGGS